MRVVIVGAGGLGGPIALCLAGRAALEIFDDDRVDVTNLHRQVQFGDADLGAPKATVLAARVGGVGHVARWTPVACELIVDASDDPVTKFAVCDWAVAQRVPYVIASALRYGGNVFVGGPGAACYRCMFEEPLADAPSCAAAGVLGPVVGVVGAIAAAYVVRLLAGDVRDAGSITVIEDARVDRAPRVVRFARRATCACSRS